MKIALWLGIAAFALGIVAWQNYPQTWSWNQKLTVIVSTPDGERSGSAITKVVWQKRNSVGNFPGSYKGEATVVDLGDGRYLFALLGEPTRYLAMAAFKEKLPDNPKPAEEVFAVMAGIRGTREVPQDRYPVMVTFDDVSDPATVRKVDPDNLAASFGAGVSLKGISLEITDEVANEGRIERVLGWLEWSRERFFAAGDGQMPLKIAGEAIARSSFHK